MRKPLSYLLTLLIGVALGSAGIAVATPAADAQHQRIEQRLSGIEFELRFLKQRVGSPLLDQPNTLSGDLQNLQSNDFGTSTKLRAICSAVRATC